MGRPARLRAVGTRTGLRRRLRHDCRLKFLGGAIELRRRSRMLESDARPRTAADAWYLDQRQYRNFTDQTAIFSMRSDAMSFRRCRASYRCQGIFQQGLQISGTRESFSAGSIAYGAKGVFVTLCIN